MAMNFRIKKQLFRAILYRVFALILAIYKRLKTPIVSASQIPTHGYPIFVLSKLCTLKFTQFHVSLRRESARLASWNFVKNISFRKQRWKIGFMILFCRDLNFQLQIHVFLVFNKNLMINFSNYYYIWKLLLIRW